MFSNDISGLGEYFSQLNQRVTNGGCMRGVVEKKKEFRKKIVRRRESSFRSTLPQPLFLSSLPL
jgi:hypothetical protein